MEGHAVKATGVVCAGCIALVALAEQIPSQGTTGWFWTGDGLGYVLPHGPWYGNWNDPENWEFRGEYVPAYPSDGDRRRLPDLGP